MEHMYTERLFPEGPSRTPKHYNALFGDDQNRYQTANYSSNRTVTHQTNLADTSSLDRKEQKLDKQFKSLLDRCNQSKDYLDTVHRSATSIHPYPRDSSTLVSPTSVSNYYFRNPYSASGSHSKNNKTDKGGAGVNNNTITRDFESQTQNDFSKVSFGETTKDTYVRSPDQFNTLTSPVADPSRYQSTEQNYKKLENEISELKKAMMTRVQSQENFFNTNVLNSRNSNKTEDQEKQYQQQTLNRTSQASTKEKKARFDLTYDPSDDEKDTKRSTAASKRESKENKPPSSYESIPKKSSLRSAVSPSSRSRSTKRTHTHDKSSSKNTSSQVTSPKHFDYLTQQRTEKTIKELNKTLNEREKAQQEKYINLKLKYKELKNFFKEVSEKGHKLEALLNKKDTQILDLQEQIRNDQDEKFKTAEIIKELKFRMDEIARGEEETRTQNIELKTRLDEQKEQHDKIDEIIRENEDKYTRELGKLTTAISDYKTDLAIQGEREAALKSRNTVLSGDLENSLRDLETFKRQNEKYEGSQKLLEKEVANLKENLEKLLNENRNSTQKLEDSNLAFAGLEQKLDRQRKNHDQERERLIEDREREIAAKKEKIRSLKDSVRDQEQMINKLIFEKKDLSNEIDRISNERKALQKDNASLQEEVDFAAKEGVTMKNQADGLKKQNDHLYETYQTEAQKNEQLHIELKSANNSLKSTQEKLAIRDKELSQVESQVDQYKIDVRKLVEENDKARQQNIKLEGELTKMQTDQSNDIAKVENKIESFAKDYQKSEAENMQLRKTEIALKKEIEILREEKEAYKKEYKNLKNVNKGLEESLQDLMHYSKSKEKIRSYMEKHAFNVVNERITEIKQKDLLETQQKQLNQKMRALDDISDMIKSHRLAQSKPVQPDQDDLVQSTNVSALKSKNLNRRLLDSQ